MCGVQISESLVGQEGTHLVGETEIEITLGESPGATRAVSSGTGPIGSGRSIAVLTAVVYETVPAASHPLAYQIGSRLRQRYQKRR
jgi:hypothetical protein